MSYSDSLPVIATLGAPSDLAGICVHCDKLRPVGLVCEALNRSIHDDLGRGVRFCPIGRHRSIHTPGWRERLRWWLRIRVQAPCSRVLRICIFGVVGLVRWARGDCPAPAEVRSERRSICAECEHLRLSMFCGLCKCALPAKTGLADSTCPAGKWDKVEVGRCSDPAKLPIVGKYLRTGCGGCGGKKA